MVVVWIIWWNEVGDIMVYEKFVLICIKDVCDVYVVIIVRDDYSVGMLFFFCEVMELCGVFCMGCCVLIMVMMYQVFWQR